MNVLLVFAALAAHQGAGVRSKSDYHLNTFAQKTTEEPSCLFQSKASLYRKIHTDAIDEFDVNNSLVSRPGHPDIGHAISAIELQKVNNAVDLKSNATLFCNARKEDECCSLTLSVLDGGCKEDEYCTNTGSHICGWSGCWTFEFPPKWNSFIINPARCQKRIPDGHSAWRPSLYTYHDSCMSGRHICGTCGEQHSLAAGKKCYSHDNCKSGCCEGIVTGINIINEPEHCFGICMDKTPGQCEHQIEDSFEAALTDFEEKLNGLKQCDAPATDDTELEDGMGCTSRNVGQFGLDLTCEPRAIPIVIAPVKSPHSFEIGCNLETCPGGAAMGLYGEFHVDPAFSIKADPVGAKYEVSLSASVNASMGLSLGAHTHCRYNQSYVFPEQPTPVVSVCGGANFPMCLSFIMQMKVEFLTDLKISVSAIAQYYTNFSIGGKGIFDMSNALKPELDGEFHAEKVEEWWSVQLEGGGTALVQVRLAPLLTFVTVPGSFISIEPYVITELSAAGHMKYVQSSGSAPPNHLQITRDVETAWQRIMKAKRKDPSCEKLLEDLLLEEDPEPKDELADTMEEEFLARGQLTEGAGFFLPKASSTGSCFAASVSLRTGAVVHGIGPPHEIGDLSSFFKKLCTFFGEAMAKLDNVEKLNCYRKALGLGDVVKKGVEICHKIVELIPVVDLPVVSGGVEGNCVDVFTTFVGEPRGGAQCLCKVGCDRVEGECPGHTIDTFTEIMRSAQALPPAEDAIPEEVLKNFTKRKPVLARETENTFGSSANSLESFWKKFTSLFVS